MSDRGEHPLPDELLPVAEWLREERPSLDVLALDRAKTRARARAAAAARPTTHGKGVLLRSRIAITMILALGILMSLGGAGLAVSGLGGSGDASNVQYSNDSGGSGGSGSSNTTTLSDPGDSSDPADVQPAAQEESSGDDGELAFTGFAAIPVLIGGLALLSSGFVLRRRSARE